MSTLYLDRKHLSIEIDGGSLTLREHDEIRQRVPLTLLERVVITAGVQLNTNTLLSLNNHNISVNLIGSRGNQGGAQLIGNPNGDVHRRLAQYALYFNEKAQQQVVQTLLSHKIRQQRLLLHTARKTRHDISRTLTKGIDSLGQILPKLEQAEAIENLMGYEGAAAARYFEAYTSLFADSLGFMHRVKRPPTDPVNACLSLGYTLLHHEAVKIINGAGLDVYLGVLHQPAYNRESLASDMIEPLRAKIDQFTWRLFAEKVLREHHFAQQNGGVYLTKEGRAIYYPAYELLARKMRKVLKGYTYAYVNFIKKQYQGEETNL